MLNLRIETVENGFVIFEEAGMGRAGKMWSFESSEALAEFIKKWGKEREGKRKESIENKGIS